MLAEAEHVEPDLIGQLDLLEQVTQALLGADGPARLGVGRQFGERVDAKFHEGMRDVGRFDAGQRP